MAFPRRFILAAAAAALVAGDILTLRRGLTAEPDRAELALFLPLGVLFFSARVAVGLLSYVFPTLLAARGVPFVGTILLAFLLLALVIGTLWAPSTQGRSLDEIADERLERQPV